jgi:DNA invertase Pin-like site-specific DNA recombinase
MVCGSRTDTTITTKPQINATVDLTCQHKNQILLVEGPEIKIRPVGARQWSMRERFRADELQAMINLYISGATTSQVAERFGISVSSTKRLLRNHSIRKRTVATRS